MTSNVGVVRKSVEAGLTKKNSVYVVVEDHVNTTETIGVIDVVNLTLLVEK